MATNKKPGKWRARTQGVRGGQTRTPFQETSEAMFLTSGYAYESAKQAEARFTGEDEGFQYSRFGNPTVTMFEERMAALEGAPIARATASGMKEFGKSTVSRNGSTGNSDGIESARSSTVMAPDSATASGIVGVWSS